jgi:hypothetical protein
MEARLRDTERDLDFDFLAFFSSSEELLDDEPARAGAATMASSPTGAATGASVSASLGVASVLFLGVVEAVAAASGAGLPTGLLAPSD